MTRTKAVRGQSLVEFALIAPVFLVLLMGAIDLGRVYFAHIALVGAVEQGARTAALKANSSDALVKAAVVAEPNATLSLSAANVTVTPPYSSRAQGSTVTVTASTTFTLISPIIPAISGSSVIPLSATASMVVQ